MTEDPYQLARDIRGIDFRTADAMAMKMGVARDAPQRLRAGVSFARQEAAIDDGHCGLPVESLVMLAVKLLDVDKALVRTALDHERKAPPKAVWRSARMVSIVARVARGSCPLSMMDTISDDRGG